MAANASGCRLPRHRIFCVACSIRCGQRKAQDNSNRSLRREAAMADKPGNQPAGAASVLASAWYEFVRLAMQAGDGKAGAAMLQALTPAGSDGQASGSIEALVAMYRQYLGEMSNLLPVVARYITGQMKPVSGTVSRLLFRIHTKDPLVSMVEQRTAEQAAVQGEAFILYASQRCMGEVRKALDAG